MLLADKGYDAEALLGPISLAPTVAQIRSPSTPTQFDLDNYVPFLFTVRTIFWSDLMDHTATLTAARKLFCRQSLTSSLLRMIVLNCHLQERLDSLSAPRRASR